MNTRAMEMSLEFVRGHLHRHHNYDYHAIALEHAEPYHLAISKTIIETVSIKTNTKIGKLADTIIKALAMTEQYEMIYGPISNGIIRYLLHNVKNDRVYRVEITFKGQYKCSCPAGTYSSSPCKHVVFIALSKGHDINVT